MKKTVSKKPVFPFIIDVRDYVSFSTIINKDQKKPGITSNQLFSNEPEESKENTFNLFGHILEG